MQLGSLLLFRVEIKCAVTGEREEGREGDKGREGGKKGKRRKERRGGGGERNERKKMKALLGIFNVIQLKDLGVQFCVIRQFCITITVKGSYALNMMLF